MKPDGHGVPGGRPEVRPGTVRLAERKRGLPACMGLKNGRDLLSYCLALDRTV